MEQDPKIADYLEYKKSKSEIKEEKNSKVKYLSWLFIVTFSGIFCVIVLFISSYFSQIDIEHEDNLRNRENSVENSFIDTEKQFSIDRRLQELFQEENAPSTARNTNVEDEVIDKDEFDSLKNSNKEVQESIIKTEKLTVETPDNTENVSKENAPTRVLIGRYDTIEEAEVAKNRMMANYNLEKPFVKKIGDIFTIQIGVYSDANTAMMMANKFSSLGYNVWLIRD